MIFIYGYGDMSPDWPDEETSPAKSVPKGWLRPSLDALVDMESHVMEASRRGSIEGIVAPVWRVLRPKGGNRNHGKTTTPPLVARSQGLG
jgi:hypothetical protein